MNFFSSPADWLASLMFGLEAWHRSTNQCSRPSHVFLYVLIGSWIALSIALVFFYRRRFPSKPKTLSLQP